MIASGEYIKGFTEIIVCSLLSEGDDYIYNLVKRINACGDGAVLITELQAPGGKRMKAADYLRGHKL